jgi:hypothetical protein
LSRFDIDGASKNSGFAEMSRKGTPSRYGPIQQAGNPHPTFGCTKGRQSNAWQAGSGVDTVELMQSVQNRTRRAQRGKQTNHARSGYLKKILAAPHMVDV